MRRLMGLTSVAVLLAACGGGVGAQPGTGVQGMVVVGPSCPVERINSPCPPHPLATIIVVRDRQGAEVARGQSGPDGRFKIDVRPGTYTVIGLNVGNTPLPRPIPTTVTIAQDQYTSITLEYDSGIR